MYILVPVILPERSTAWTEPRATPVIVMDPASESCGGPASPTGCAQADVKRLTYCRRPPRESTTTVYVRESGVPGESPSAPPAAMDAATLSTRNVSTYIRPSANRARIRD